MKSGLRTTEFWGVAAAQLVALLALLSAEYWPVKVAAIGGVTALSCVYALTRAHVKSKGKEEEQ